MPRVLRIHNRLIIGGPAINVTYLTRYMAPEFETMLVIGGKDEHEQDAIHLTRDLGIEPIVVNEMRRNIHPRQDGIAYQKIKEIIQKFKPDVVHTHAAKSGVIGRLAADACKVPVIVHTFHGHVFHSYFSPWQTKMFIHIERYLARKSSGIVAISQSQKEELANVYKICPEEKLEVIPLGLDLDKFHQRQDEKRAMFRNRYQIEEDEIAIGIIGRIVPVKNHELFVAAAKKVLDASSKRLRFVIVGDGDMRPSMEASFQAAGIDYTYYPEQKRKATAFCTSWLTQIDEVLAGLDIVALTSHNEGTPVSLIEAQASSRPVVSTHVGGVADMVMDGKCGFVTPPANAELFAEALLKLVQDEKLRSDFGAFGKDFVQSKFSYQRLVRDMSAYYHRLIDESKHRK
ncbi:MAG: glycosyltransferase [Bacteroidetes bacterium]|nr:glycosyltransferase [Bacteroidota bacterium]MBS1740126.1 glycosyltransferase [Bacteroidota bacterium]